MNKITAINNSFLLTLLCISTQIFSMENNNQRKNWKTTPIQQFQQKQRIRDLLLEKKLRMQNNIKLARNIELCKWIQTFMILNKQNVLPPHFYNNPTNNGNPLTNNLNYPVNNFNPHINYHPTPYHVNYPTIQNNPTQGQNTQNNTQCIENQKKDL